MSKSSSNDSLVESFLAALDLDALARETEWSPKSRKITALGWCLSLCRACSLAAPSLRSVAHYMGLICALTVTKQAVHKRLMKGGADLLRKAVEAAVAAKARLPAAPPLGGFARVLIQDSTVIALPKSLEKHYPGWRNQRASSAALKIQALYDLAGDAFLKFVLSPFTRNDQTAAADALEVAGKGDLVLRDLGYFGLESLRALAGKGAYFLSRYRSGVLLFDPGSGERVDLLKALRGKRSADMPVLLGEEARLPVRLMAVKLKQEVADSRRRKAKANRDRRARPSAEALELMDWQIMIANCGPELLPLDKVWDLYSMRWRIETIFKSWKSGLNIDAIPSSVSKPELDAFICASLLKATLAHAVIIPYLERCDPDRKISVCKLMNLIAISADLIGSDPKANEILLMNLSKHSRYEKRKRQSSLDKWDRLVLDMENLS